MGFVFYVKLGRDFYFDNFLSDSNKKMHAHDTLLARFCLFYFYFYATESAIGEILA
jgi:hypothetical protein